MIEGWIRKWKFYLFAFAFAFVLRFCSVNSHIMGQWFDTNQDCIFIALILMDQLTCVSEGICVFFSIRFCRLIRNIALENVCVYLSIYSTIITDAWTDRCGLCWCFGVLVGWKLKITRRYIHVRRSHLGKMDDKQTHFYLYIKSDNLL